MSKYRFIYCNKCKDFYLSWNVDFGNMTKVCAVCHTKNIKEFDVDSFSEMAKIERIYKISKIIILKIMGNLCSGPANDTSRGTPVTNP